LPVAEPIGFLLGTAPRPLSIYPGDVLTMGRDPQNVISLADVLASRRHAVLECNAAGIVSIRDLGSANGTWLNNVLVVSQLKMPVVSGDYIRIGGKLFSFASNSPDLEPKALGARVQSMETLRDGMFLQDGKLVEKPMRRGNAHEVVRTQKMTPLGAVEPALAGSLSDQNLAQVIQYLNTNAKTGELYLKGKQRGGIIAFNNGQIFYAETGDRKGVIAIYVCAREHEGTFSFQSSDSPPSYVKNVSEPMMQIIFECCKRMDESQLAGG